MHKSKNRTSKIGVLLVVVIGIFVLSGCGNPMQMREKEMKSPLEFLNMPAPPGAKVKKYNLSGYWVGKGLADRDIEIVQNGNEVKGYWKRIEGECSYRVGKIWFEAKIDGIHLTGTRTLCDTSNLNFTGTIVDGGKKLWVGVYVRGVQLFWEFVKK